MNNSLGVTFNGSSSSTTGGLGEDYAALEQENPPKSSDDATLRDAVAMLDYVQQGNSAFDYIAENCSSVRVVDGKVTITIGFFVWPSRMDLEYSLRTTEGVISDSSSIYREHRSFSIVFNNSSSENVGYLFEGTLRPEMPFYTEKGVDISPDPTITVNGPAVQLSREATTSLRANVIAEGYRHELVLTLSEAGTTKIDPETGEEVALEGYTIPTPKVFVDWGAEDDEETNDSLTMEIPACAESLLNACPGDDVGGGTNLNIIDDDDNLYYFIYWDTCEGEIVDQFWGKYE